jgi:hypothetical protein
MMPQTKVALLLFPGDIVILTEHLMGSQVMGTGVLQLHMTTHFHGISIYFFIQQVYILIMVIMKVDFLYAA